MESSGDITVSNECLLFFHVNTVIGMGVLNILRISPSDAPSSFRLIYLSERYMEEFIRSLLSAFDMQKSNGGLRRSFNSLKNKGCRNLQFCSTASSAYFCRCESIVVYIFSPSL